MGWGATDWIAVAGCAQVTVLAGAAFFAKRAVDEARRLRSAQTRPYVVVYANLSNVSRTLIDLVVENIGQTPARNVSVTFSPKLESSLTSAPGDDRVNDWVALKEGIPYLAPRQRMTHLLDSAISRYAEDSTMTRRYEVTVSYSGVSPTHSQKNAAKEFSEHYVIDLGVWFGSHYASEFGIHDIGKTMSEMAKSIDRWTEGFDGIRVYVVDLEKYQADRVALIEQRIANHHAESDDAEAAGP